MGAARPRVTHPEWVGSQAPGNSMRMFSGTADTCLRTTGTQASCPPQEAQTGVLLTCITPWGASPWLPELTPQQQKGSGFLHGGGQVRLAKLCDAPFMLSLRVATEDTLTRNWFIIVLNVLPPEDFQIRHFPILIR